MCKSENILLGREVRTILMTKHLPPSFTCISVTSWIYLGRVHCCCQDPNLNKQPNGISSRVSLLISCLQYIEYTTKTKIEDILNLILINKYYFFYYWWNVYFLLTDFICTKSAALIWQVFFCSDWKKIKLNL